MSFPIYLDENVDIALAALLRADGHDVLTTRDAGRSSQSLSDEDQLLFASLLDRAIFTHNLADFAGLAQSWATNPAKSHAGIILSRWRPVHELRERFRTLFDRYPAGMHNICDYL